MNNKKSKTFTSVFDLVKPKKAKLVTSASISDLIKPQKTEIETSASVSDLVKSKKAKIGSISDLIKSKTAKKSKKSKMTDLIKPKKRYLYLCHCKLCNGAEVDFRTQESHTNSKSLWDSEDARKNQEDTITARKQNKPIIIKDVNPTKKRKREQSPNPDSFQQNSSFDPFNEDTDSSRPNDNENIHTLFSSSQSSSRPSYFHVPALNENEDSEYIDQGKDDDEDMNQGEDDEDKGDEDGEDNGDDNEDMNQGENDEDKGDEDDGNGDNNGDGDGNENDDDEDSNIEDLFASPEFDSDEIFAIESLNDSIGTEIILWVFKFQQRFRLSDTALEALIKFLCVVLTHLDKSQFKDFPTSLYIAKKMLNIFQPKMRLAICSDCHKLHNVKNIVEYKEEGEVAIMNCSHEEYPNNPIPSRRNKCNNPLSIIKRNRDKTIAIPRMLYPKPSVRQQLSMLYQRPGFENMLKLSGIQRGHNIYSDIYDGKVWKTFPFDGTTFFTEETATTHLGLLINLDWFQPFTYTQHSTGAIFASICNLPRSERNKPENIIYLGFLPGPKEVGLERINHYLAPVVDELLELWNGWKIPKTFERPEGLEIKVALIVSSSDTPATRKIFGHGGAAMKCYRCEKRTTYSGEYRKTHYGGMENYDEWVTNPADASLHRKHAQEWLECNSKSTRENHFKEHGVRWSELLRLPYMDPIRFAVVDPMHCLFLGIAKWIIKSIFINQGKLTMDQLSV